jgi:threonine/homoserine/homoserine lactone efflux protein
MDNLFVKGLIVGFCLAAPVGPIAVLCVQRTMQHGRMAGFVSGLGAAAADALYGTLAAFGVTFISEFLLDHRMFFQRVGGAILCVLGVRLLLLRPPQNTSEKKTDRGLSRDFLSTLVLTLTNPMTFIAFAAIFTTLGIGVVRGHSVLTVELVGGVFLGSAVWFTFLIGMVNIFRDRFRYQTLVTINKATGIFVIGVGIFYLFILRRQPQGAPEGLRRQLERMEHHATPSPGVTPAEVGP